jgi:hypothetical protein
MLAPLQSLPASVFDASMLDELWITGKAGPNQQMRAVFTYQGNSGPEWDPNRRRSEPHPARILGQFASLSACSEWGLAGC